MGTQTSKRPVRAAIYTRISEDRSGQALGVKRQRDTARELARDRGWEVVGEFSDNDISAYGGKRRPGYVSLMRAVEAGEVDRIVVYMTSRLWRNSKERAVAIERLAAHRVGVIPTSGPELDFSTATGRMLAGILGEFDTAESAIKGERISAAAAQRATLGRHGGGQRRFGYEHSGVRLVSGPDGDMVERPSGPLQLVPAEAAAIARGYEQVLEGVSLRQIAIQWNEGGLTGPMGAKFGAVTVRGVLLRPLNAGLATYKGAVVGASEAPAIVDEETYFAAKAILTDPARRTRPGRPVASLLGPVLRCGVCMDAGASGVVGARNTQRSKGPAEPVYTCRDGSHVSRNRDRINEYVSALVVLFIQDRREQLRRPATMPTASKAAVAEADRLRQRLDALAEQAATGDLEAADFAEAARRVRARLADAEKRIATLSGQPAVGAVVATGDIEAWWQRASVTQRREVIKDVVARVVLRPAKRTRGFNPSGISVEWRADG